MVRTAYLQVFTSPLSRATLSAINFAFCFIAIQSRTFLCSLSIYKSNTDFKSLSVVPIFLVSFEQSFKNNSTGPFISFAVHFSQIKLKSTTILLKTRDDKPKSHKESILMLYQHAEPKKKTYVLQLGWWWSFLLFCLKCRSVNSGSFFVSSSWMLEANY